MLCLGRLTLARGVNDGETVAFRTVSGLLAAYLWTFLTNTTANHTTSAMCGFFRT